MGLKKGNVYARIDSVGWSKENNIFVFVNLYKASNKNKVDLGLNPTMIERKRLPDGSVDPTDKYTSENISQPGFNLVSELYAEVKKLEFFSDFQDDI